MSTNPWDDPSPVKSEKFALDAVVRGEATPEQQMTAMKWILHRACGAGLSTFHADPHIQSFRAGRRSVALLITEVLTTDPGNYRDDPNKHMENPDG